MPALCVMIFIPDYVKNYASIFNTSLANRQADKNLEFWKIFLTFYIQLPVFSCFNAVFDVRWTNIIP